MAWYWQWLGSVDVWNLKIKKISWKTKFKYYWIHQYAPLHRSTNSKRSRISILICKTSKKYAVLVAKSENVYFWFVKVFSSLQRNFQRVRIFYFWSFRTKRQCQIQMHVVIFKVLPFFIRLFRNKITEIRFWIPNHIGHVRRIWYSFNGMACFEHVTPLFGCYPWNQSWSMSIATYNFFIDCSI